MWKYKRTKLNCTLNKLEISHNLKKRNLKKLWAHDYRGILMMWLVKWTDLALFQCKKLARGKCKRMTEGMIANCKKCLSNLMQCEEIYTSDDPIGNFAKALLNYHNHYQDTHSSTWCSFHPKVEKNNTNCILLHQYSFLNGLLLHATQNIPRKRTKSTGKK